MSAKPPQNLHGFLNLSGSGRGRETKNTSNFNESDRASHPYVGVNVGGMDRATPPEFAGFFIPFGSLSGLRTIDLHHRRAAGYSMMNLRCQTAPAYALRASEGRRRFYHDRRAVVAGEFRNMQVAANRHNRHAKATA